MAAPGLVQTVLSSEAPPPIGPYTQGKIVSTSAKMIYLSGMIALDTKGNMPHSDVTGQTELVMQNIGKELEAAGASYKNVIKSIGYLDVFLYFKKLFIFLFNK